MRTPPPLKALEIASIIALPDQRVAVVGDVHGNFRWLDIVARAVQELAPEVTTMLQLGDWAMDPDTTDEALDGTAIERIYVTLGNHENWGQITPLLDAHPGAAVRVSKITWLLPRPGRLTIGGRSVLSLGGAVSVDRAWRQEGVSYWKDEEITSEHVKSAIAGGPAEVMLTHEPPAGTPVRSVQEILRTNPMGFPDDALRDSANSRARVAKVWNIVYPELLIHGHMHAPGGGQTEYGLRVASLGQDGQQGNLGILDMRTLRIETPSLRQIREAAG
ncbi:MULTISPECIES: metallophosphoesterase [unclassified Microbacterium]|uniref:metallophosphoesterase family protein n=1 Tax=unclassified Microbacterium TaxID=2609290 RepID=UPI0021A55473|nr:MULTISPECIES: metallophosphoesterase [unclassified Microbacterium]MCT1365047.1 metallophosphoesterase [Microbacterium sp. p3-SID131]MCT1377064.1 metallophosphoesterase [Microbacterium sp. p3-SID337]